ncbi:MAG: lysoplasmalogenase [Anaerolineae bacterium]
MDGYVAFLIALVFVAADWLAVARSWRRVEYICKPAAVLSILGAAWLLTQGSHDPWQAGFFLPGLALSVAGDISLMLRKDSFFFAGLVAFLLAHVCYVVGLNPTLPPSRSLFGAIPVAVIAALSYRPIATSLRGRGDDRLLVPTALYAAVLGTMLFSAWATLFRTSWTALRQGLAIVGASLFFLSDSILARDRFVRSFPSARLWVHTTYHLGQLALAASIGLIG